MEATGPIAPATNTRPRRSRAEIEQRVAILKRLRTALIAQRDHFRDYLAHLERVEADGGRRDLAAELSAEQSITRQILAAQRTIEPLGLLYRAAYPESVDEIGRLADSLERVKLHVVRMMERDRSALHVHLAALRDQVRTLRAAIRS